MAGDHKCPVCNSTFTRPQHVARHMRSHTGDRPYKCQHCGDQFARSDLLSRHINKCHASEKPPTTTAPNNRRKGTAAASRATTSKQACDQCVTSSLPCDGCNPCSKCVQRKCRCTYVKFHRQTAPAGPGHPPPNTLPNATHRGGLPLGARLPDEFLMQPAGAAGGLGSMYLPPDYGLPGASMYAPNPYDSRPSTASSLSMSTGAREPEPSPEMLARYRAQAELLSRAGVLPSGALAGMSTAGTVMPGMYNTDSATFARYGLASSQAPAWGQPGGHPYAGKDIADYGNDVQSFPGGGGSAALSSHPPTHAAPFPNIPSASGHASGSDAHAAAAGYGGGIPFPQHHPSQGHPSGHHRRSEELSDDYGSDSGISVPSSANSSSVHLPMDGSQRRPYTAESASPTIPYQNSARKDDGTNEGGFSSAFGLMSLDDPNVLAGLANDSAPFFSALSQFSHGEGDNQSANSSTTSLHTESSTNDGSSQTSHTSESSVGSMGNMGLSLPTPTPELIASLKNGGLLSAGGRDALDSKELREFWKQYMRTPLTGPGANTPLFPLQTPTGPGHQLGAGMAGSSTAAATGRPSPTRRHSRVASLPSMKTPPILGQGTTPELNSFAPVGSFSLSLGPKARERQNQHQANRDDQHAHDDRGHQHPQMSYSNMRTTLHGDADDLKSYEQAVLARKAPTTLNLLPRRRGTMPAGSSAPSVVKQNHMSPPQLPGQGHQQSSNTSGSVGDSSNRERPSSSSSSLADAFGSPQQRHQQQHHQEQQHQDHHYAMQDQYRMHHQHQQSQSSSESPRESSVGAESDGGHSTSYRPSFKRLASQTLGPPNAKRALLGPAGWDDVRRGAEESESIEEDDEVDEGVATSGRFAKHGHEGPRRFSLPTTSGEALTLPPIRTAVGGHDQAQSQSPVSTYQQ